MQLVTDVVAAKSLGQPDGWFEIEFRRLIAVNLSTVFI